MSKQSFLLILGIFILFIIGVGSYVYYQIKLVPPTAEQIEEQHKAFVEASNGGDIDGAIVLAEKAAMERPNDTRALLDQAFAYLDKGSQHFQEDQYADKAIAVAIKVLAIEPNNAEAYKTLGYAYEIKQNYAKAIDSYNTAISLEPEAGYFYVRRGHAYDLMGKMDLAVSDYKKAIELTPGDPSAMLNLARYYYSTYDATNTIAYANAAIAVDKKARLVATANDLIGLTYIDLKDYGKAAIHFEAAIKADPNYENPYLFRAYLNYLKYTDADGKLTVAEAEGIEKDLQKVLSIHPGNSDAYFQKAEVAEALGNIEDAKTHYQKSLSLVDGDITLSATDKIDMKDDIAEALKKYE